jgi:tetratricopeptide (TPR) repeat protein
MKRLIILVLAAYLAGCSSPSKVPVVSGGQVEPVYKAKTDNTIDVGNGVYIKPQSKRAEISGNGRAPKARHNTSAGVARLLASAESYALKKKYPLALSTLERAQRIDPKEPKVYYELALINLKQGRPIQAEQLSRKGLSLAQGNPVLQKSLWTAMAKALDAQGKTRKAQRALQRAYKIQF